MIFFDTPIQVFTALFMFLISFFIIEVFRKKFELEFNKTYLLYFWHTFFAIVYMIYTENHSADAKMYYYFAAYENDNLTFGFKTNFLKYITFLFYYIFNLSWFGMFLLYSLLGFLGILAFWSSLNSLTRNESLRKLILLIVFLPGLNFWSVAIGKDSIFLLCIGFLIYSLINLKDRYFYFFISILIMFFTRPHICGVVLLSLFGSLLIIYMYSKKLNILYKILIFFLLSFLIILIINFVLNFLGINFSEIISFIEDRSLQNQKGGASIDITNMNFIEKFFSYLFRPFPFEINSIVGIYIGFENLILFLFSCYLMYIMTKINFKENRLNLIILFSIIYVFIMWSLMAMTTANMGISIRQKWMFLPFLIYLMIYIIDLYFKKKELK